MNSNYYSLVEVQEVSFNIDGWLKFIRIEIFVAIAEPALFRGKVWLSESYNLYPSNLNTNLDGGNLQSLHSEDVVNRDITAILSCGQSLLEGKKYESKNIFINELHIEIGNFIKKLQSV